MNRGCSGRPIHVLACRIFHHAGERACQIRAESITLPCTCLADDGCTEAVVQRRRRSKSSERLLPSSISLQLESWSYRSSLRSWRRLDMCPLWSQSLCRCYRRYRHCNRQARLPARRTQQTRHNHTSGDGFPASSESFRGRARQPSPEIPTAPWGSSAQSAAQDKAMKLELTAARCKTRLPASSHSLRSYSEHRWSAYRQLVNPRQRSLP